MKHGPTDAANTASTRKRREMAEWRRGLVAGKLTMADLFDVRPECFAHRSVMEVLKMRPGWNTAALARLNRWAVFCGVNLAQPFGAADEETVEWVGRALAASDGDTWSREFHREGVDIRESVRTATRLTQKAVEVATTMAERIEAHREAIRDENLNADVGKADAELWAAAKLAKELVA